MIILISIITIVLYIIFIAFTLHNLNITIDNKIKIAYITIGTIITFLITLIIFNISTNGVEYENKDMIGNVRNIILAVFVPVNGLIVMPYLANLISKINTNEITQEKFKKKIIILAIIFIVVIIFECSYFKSTQLGILKILGEMQS